MHTVSDLPDGVDPAEASLPDRSISILSSLWIVAKRNKWIIAAIFGVMLALAAIMTLLTPPSYTAASRIEVNPIAESVTQVEGALPSVPDDNREFYQTQYNLLEAESQARRVARSLNLLSDREFLEANGLDDLDGSIDMQLREVSEHLSENIAIVPIRGSALIDISYTDPNPTRAAQIANMWVEEYVSGNFDRRLSSSTEAANKLEEELVNLRRRLEESERELVAYTAGTQIINLGETVSADGRTIPERSLTTTQLSALNEELARATARRIAAESALASPASSVEGMNNQALNSMRESRAQLSAEYARLLEQFTPDYPPARGLRSQIDQLEADIRSEERRLRQANAGEVEQARQAERRLAGRVEGLKQDFMQERSQNIQYNILQRDVDTNRQLYDALLQRYKEIGVVGVGENNVFVVDEAQVPSEPSAPSLVQNLLLALLISGALSAATVFVRESLHQTIDNAEMLQEYLGLPFLGGIPKASGETATEALAHRSSEMSEAYATVRTNLSFATATGFPDILMVTSAQPNEGKTTSSHALALMLAHSGKSVLLIDSDMRNPSIHKELDIELGAGVSNYLTSGNHISEYVRSTAVTGFDVVTAGPSPPSASDLLTTQRLPGLLDEAKQSYDHVIIDAPPVLTISDAPLLAGAVGDVVFVIEAGRIDRREIARAVAQTQRSGAKVHGAILTKVSLADDAYGYGYGHGYGYGQNVPEAA